MIFEKYMLYKDDKDQDLICIELTPSYAFLCPIDLEKNIVDAASVMMYSTEQGDTPILTIELAGDNLPGTIEVLKDGVESKSEKKRKNAK
jgi:hypothetical protein